MPADPARSGRAAFDHDPPRERRARRPAPDWGGDDLFDHVPRRRFARTDADVHWPRHGERTHGRAGGAVAVAEWAPEPATRPGSQPPREPDAAPAGARRTVTITGRPDRAEGLRQEPGRRSVEQRIHASPDRIAAWACALGVLLILLALLT